MKEPEERPDNLITLTDENGNDVVYEFLDLIEYKGGRYVVLIETDESADEVVILRVESEPGDEMESYMAVDNDKILAAVFNIFKERFRDVFQFGD